MASGHLLIVAPDIDLRRSLEFLLEAAGYTVSSHAALASRLSKETFDCTILDHGALPGSEQEMPERYRTSGPIILLAGAPSPVLEAQAFRVVRKPLLGEPLLAAVAQALRWSRDSGRTK
ncbi:hypothetical protein [Devosia sp. SL43]|uniref:hypothetical protein n=1 Tax=Devosia sp. SL43 TaxID=2806348 RepID=UPI001F414DC3|nr:hypothetical protein [Devosia sp. SL43]UJW85658.1 hypothetical protein IM737_20105 [Devosia sp. SL43]